MKQLTKKQANFVRELIENPKISATEAAARAYNASTREVASAVATENLRKPLIMQHLQANSERAEQVIVDLLKAEKDEVKLAASKDILDRVHGKATQKIEQSTTGVTLNIDLTGLGKALED
jgi:phage terminase small subunit